MDGTSESGAQGGLPGRLPQAARLYLRPLGLVAGAPARALRNAGQARPLAGGPLAFTVCELLIRDGGRILRHVAPAAEVPPWIASLEAGPARRLATFWDRLSAPRPGLRGLLPPGPQLMGVVNVTPDSFSDGGRHLDPDAALASIEAMVAAGAAVIDLGGESTRPGAEPVSEAEELARLKPVLDRLPESGLTERVLFSIDTRRSAVMRAALERGVRLINDVSALSDDPESLPLVAARGAFAALMDRLPHGTEPPESGEGAPPPLAALLDVCDRLEARVAACEAAGIGRERLFVDPGIGFGKSGPETLAILEGLALLQGLGSPLLLGISRKGLTGALDRATAPEERLPLSLAGAILALDQGVTLLRVHDVAESAQALAVWRLQRETAAG